MHFYQRWIDKELVESRVEDAPIKREWPVLLIPLKLLAQPQDRGLGDIVERVIGPVGGDAYKFWYENTFGKPCGCTQRADRLNERFPLNS